MNPSHHQTLACAMLTPSTNQEGQEKGRERTCILTTKVEGKNKPKKGASHTTTNHNAMLATLAPHTTLLLVFICLSLHLGWLLH
eukprot:m.372428 g.372428  ORF g.372428 m.372428 type:complete len:84 (-) comp63078_c0_seq1:8-259(-)